MIPESDQIAARNRVNQRNFRARRQNYIKELEERVRKYETEGTQATVEVQCAARRVTEQNLKLKQLLVEKFGLSEQEIEGYLCQSHGSSNVAKPPTKCVTNSSGPTRHWAGAMSFPSDQSAASRFTQTPHPGSLQPDMPLPTSEQQAAIDLADLHQAVRSQSSATSSSTTYSNNNPPAAPSSWSSMSDNTSSEPHQLLKDAKNLKSSICIVRDNDMTRPDETSCEDAARIIASMRGQSSQRDGILQELGCTDPKSCKVKNMSIFAILDDG